MDETKKLTVQDVMAARHSSNFHDVLLAYLEQMEAIATHPLLLARPSQAWLDAPFNPAARLPAEPVAYPSIMAVMQAKDGTNFREVLIDYLAYVDNEIIEIYSSLAKKEHLLSLLTNPPLSDEVEKSE